MNKTGQSFQYDNGAVFLAEKKKKKKGGVGRFPEEVKQ